MAKSIRSKWRRKMRAVKRVRYAEKELAMLKKTLGIPEEKTPKEGEDVVMEGSDDVETVVEGNVIEFSLKEKNNTEPSKPDRKTTVDGMKIGEMNAILKEKLNMDVITENDIKKLGKYPHWMNQKKIQKLARKARINKKIKPGKGRARMKKNKK